MSNKTDNTLFALLAGAAIGAGIGILFAPDKGSKTRRKIKDNFEIETANLKEKINETSDHLKNKFDKVKTELESEFTNLVNNVDIKTDDIITNLEKKLEELKKKRAKERE